jgi:hypothetical protein
LGCNWSKYVNNEGVKQPVFGATDARQWMDTNFDLYKVIAVTYLNQAVIIV